MKIGLIVAIETDAVFDYYTNIETLPAPHGFELYHTEKNGKEIFILHTGMGEIAAASGVQYLITRCGVEVIVNFGVVGGLTQEMKAHKVCIVSRVVHYKYDCSEFLDLKIGQVAGHDSIFLPVTQSLLQKALEMNPDLLPVTCCSGDKFVDTPEEKNQIHTDFEGDVCDMESAGIILTCEANRIPCVMLKAVSDGLVGGAKEFFAELKAASAKALRVADEIIDKTIDIM